MQYQKAQNAIILRLDPGDELISSIKELVTRNYTQTTKRELLTTNKG